MRPKLIIIQGAPASGKTTISRDLVQRLDGVLLVSKDSIKEFLFDNQPSGDRDWSRMLGKASIAAMYEITKVFLANGRHVMLESAFDAEYAREDIKRLNADVFEVYCRCDEDKIIERFKARATSERHPGHLDDMADYDGEAIRRFQPIGLGTTRIIDTTDSVDARKCESLARDVELFLEEK
jgi:predicted kinase